MGRLIPLFALADLAIMVIALIDCLSVEEFQIRALPRIAWVFLILLFSPVGGIAWFVAGRPERTAVPGGQAGIWRPGNGFPEAQRPPASRAPDDDPEFLRRLAPKAQQEDGEMLRRWEQDLRRREEELRRREKPEEPPAPSPN
ncbi:MAG: PLDc_N domain-containing protein [Micromonosporaceae bacterium]|nr:PLDc_N domain-containing protein [Micromonosporaceae bacterium]